MVGKTITRESIAKTIKRETGITIKQAHALVNQLLLAISTKLKEGKVISIRKFGTWSSYAKGARLGRNPKTMQEVIIPARKVVKFEVAPSLKKRINDNINMIKS